MNDSKLKVVLHRLGDPSPITIRDDKCLIRTVYNDQKIDCCAIYNGPNGTALRSCVDSILVNGEPTAAKWLNAGDQIELPCASRIEVKEANLLRPVMPIRSRSAAEIDQQLAALGREPDSQVSQNTEATAAEAIPVSADESLPGPISTGISDNDISKTSAMVQPEIAQTETATPVPTLPSQPASVLAPPVSTPGPQSESEEVPVAASSAVEDNSQTSELESIFARLGVTSVGSIACPNVESNSDSIEMTPVETVPTQPVQISEPLVESNTVENVPVSTAAEPDPVLESHASVMDEAANLRKELESIFATTPSTDSAEPATAAVPVVPTEPVQTPANMETATPPISASAEAAANVSPAAENSSAVEVAPAILAAVETPQEVVEDSAASIAPTAPTESPVTSAADPLSDLPDDLRNQLNDLVSSLENESPAPTALTSGLVTPETVATQIEPVAAVPAVVPQIEPVEPPDTVAPVGRKETDSISNMFEDAMRAIQGKPEASAASEIQAAVPVEPADPVELAAPVAAETVAAPAAEKDDAPKSQSVADILGSMGMAVPGSEEAETTHAVPVFAPKPEPTPAAPQNVPATPVFANMQNAAAGKSQTAVEPTAATTGGNAEDDIQAYMNRLLNRAKPEPEPAIQTGTETEATPEPVVEAPVVPGVLSAEEFVPTHKASRPENYDTLREIANSSSRSAIRQSTRKAQKESILIKVIACLVSLIFAGIAFTFGLMIPAGVFLFVAVMCIILCFLRKDALPKTVAKTIPVAETPQVNA
ncbi:ribonuclease E domain-containing protein [Mariniblastus fucicola]|uniref:Uncharacterized protein n=1 Tax=Mariniblastus fucicola TaxID=980251 RepID=A0A5B9PG38_9BACT|nr:hypothetical protein [Mariniblastus fucicola]QEG24559.1 hypothetical protein MFFC18_44790 [Mariniblastus fucicola]